MYMYWIDRSFYKAIIVNVLLWGGESWAIKSKEVHDLRVFQFRCLRSLLKINIMHKVSRVRMLEMCQVQDIIQTMDLRRIKWLEKLSFMDFTRCPRLLFGCWMYGKVYHRNGKPLKTIGHSHTDSLKRIGEASLLEDGTTAKAPFVRKQRGITVNPQVRDLFRLIQSESWPAMMEKYLGMDPGSYSTFKPSVPGKIPPRRTKRIVNAPSTPSNSREPSVCGNCQCLGCHGPCLSPLSRPPYCDSCGFRHGPTYTQCSYTHTPTSTTTPSNAITADDIEAAITDLSSHSPQSTDCSTLSSMINSLTSFTAASVLSAIEDDIAPTNLADGFASEDDLFSFL